ncbi:CHASE2 domain-containing protein [Aquabacterium sp.]|uniref:CHASE2 domain-containing protein n=1 Tax=Aquabacterium sp. TaxID=1872578 RepID=UPI002C46C999|nr:CHASE2 domain-containing protein [Aquabacterium sp.]HSW07211.1 CHASE2 domain-containing protein [Aquabacterium sp.]
MSGIPPGLAWVPLLTAVLGALLAWAMSQAPVLRRADDALADAQLRWLAPPVPPGPVLVLDIDEASLRALAPTLGGWPLRRDAYALVIDYLREAGARLVAIDVVMADGRNGDAALQRALVQGAMPVVLAAAAWRSPADAMPTASVTPRDPVSSAPALPPWPAQAPATAWPGWLLPAEGLRGAPIGLVSMPLDGDGMLRRLAVLHRAGDQRLAALPIVVQQVLAGAVPLAWRGSDDEFQLAGSRWPADAEGRLRLPPLAAEALPRLPFHAVAGAALGQPTVPGLREQLADRVVFIGSSAGLGNRVMTPAGQLTGTEWLAASHAVLAAGRVIRPPPGWSLPAALGLALLPALALWRRGRPVLLPDALATLLAAAAVLGGGSAALVLAQTQLPALLPLATLAAGLLLALAAQQRDNRLAAEHLRYERAVAEAANAAKSEFLASMSHELRTPLNGVIGACQLLQDHGGDEQRRGELLDIIRASSNHLLGLIDGVLHLARIESGVLELVREDFNLIDAIEAVMATAAAPARSKGLQMACVPDPQLPSWRHGDVTRLRQVLLNLLGNAVKFTPQGEVVLRVAAGDAPEQLRFEVSDTGIGLDAAAQERIFEPFAQADSGTTRRFGGSGLGLTICRKLVLAMGGRITVDSTAGQGACFTVILSLPAALQPHAEAEPLGYRVAVVEPHEASAQALTCLLQRMGCQALRCSTAQALHAACTWPDAQGRPAWLLVATDAPEALALMETAVDWVDPERVIGMNRLSWYAAESARERVRLPRSVIKPVLRSALVSRFGAAARLEGAATGPQRLAAADAPRAVGRVLIVEDDPVNQTIVSAMLGQAGFYTELATDGRQALQRCAEMVFDVLLMDWQMPDMDGIEVTRRLRAGDGGEAGRHVPVVALTANAFAEDRAACLAAGMNDFLSKPVVADDLVAVVSRWCQVPRPAPSPVAGRHP